MSRRRKSEDIDGHGKHRAAKRQMGTYSTNLNTLEDDSYEDVEIERDTEGLFVKQPHAQRDRETKKDKSLKLNQVKFASQYGEGGRTDNQRFTEASKTSKKGKGMKKGARYLDDIKHIVDGQAEITGNLGAMAHQSLSLEAQFSDFFVESHQMVLSDILCIGATRHGRLISLKDACTSITENGHQLLAAVDHLGLELGSHMLSTQAKEQECEQNVLSLEGILEGGKREGEARAATLLTGLRMQDVQSGDDEASGALFDDATDDEGRVTWAHVAAKQGKAVGKLASAFLRD
ncbi:hypothetical protein V499_05290 [Pseudogymnoascus sp. VKM F-103]|uniref:Uncharacterized protein n=1 Tax=Pseudogymnoascus verrucosus TaxID=342668 RepID=A0A1B8GG24_9PEZI|nr:uncharacterized protein VE01_06276 [Pseudogymnoascus verrucosus]KFY74682.1 hypothetical protein V499_05290 [Pseudogymnoascus sp. VKM F-103]OBT94775.1 hypothetical protein VE01_06276 [Pseudogymnoascus verrucosus]